MKYLFVLLVALVPFLSNCKKESSMDPNLPIKEIAWNSLSSQAKATVTIDWKKAKVEQSVYNSRSVYAVVFNTKYDALLGPITVYVDSSTREVLGQALRD